MESVALDVTLGILAILALVLANGFFVAAEFAIVTVRKTRIDQLIAEGNRLAVTVRRAVVDAENHRPGLPAGVAALVSACHRRTAAGVIRSSGRPPSAGSTQRSREFW